MKKIFFTLFLFAAVLLGVFWQNVMVFAVEWYCNKQCREFFAAEFHTDGIHFDAGALVFDKPAIISEIPIAEGGINFRAEQLEIKIQPRWRKRRIDLDILLTQPDLIVKKTSVDVRGVMSEFFASNPLVPLHTKVAVTQGSVEFQDFRHDPPQRQKIYYEVNGERTDQDKGSVVVSLDDPSLKNNCVILSLGDLGKSVFTLDLNFDSVHCATLLNAAGNFAPYLHHLTVSQGTIGGKMSLSIPEEGHPYAQGTLTLKDVSFAVPALELKGGVKESHLHLIAATPQNHASPQTIGRLELAKEMELTFENEGIHECDISQLVGAINFETSNKANLELEGKCTHHGQSSQVAISGGIRFGREKEENTDIDVTVRLANPDLSDTKARFVTKTTEGKNRYTAIELERFNAWDFELLKMIALPYYPSLNYVEMKNGHLDASVIATMHGFKVTGLTIDKIAATKLEFYLNPWDLDIEIGHLSGELSVNLSADHILNTLNADLIISRGFAQFSAEHLKPCRLSDLSTKLVIRKGIIEKSIVKGMFAGLNGTIDLDGTSQDGEWVKFNFHGKSDELLSILPQNVKTRIKQEFGQDEFSFQASLYPSTTGITVEGAATVRGLSERNGQTLEFGFGVERASQQLWGKWPPVSGGSILRHAGMEATIAAMPAIASPAAHFKSYWLKRELGVAGLTITSGWLQAQNLPLKKYIEPLLFPDGNLTLRGQGDFQVTFDHQSAFINYDLRNATLENNDFSVEVKSMHASNRRDPMLPLPGTIYFDYGTTCYYAVMPIINGTYFEKSSGLLFTDMNSLAILEDRKLHLTDVTTLCNGMSMGGKIDLDLTSPVKGEYDVNIYASHIQGTFSQLQHLFSHFDHLKFFQKIPLEGNLSLLDNEANLKMSFGPQGLKVRSHIEGILCDGVAAIQNTDIKISGLQANFEYDLEKDNMLITDIQGNLFIGNDDQGEKYILSGDRFNFSNIDAKEIDFDLWIGDQGRDLIRLTGRSTQAQNEPTIEVLFDQESTHFGNVYPRRLELSMQDWTQIKRFSMDVSIPINTLINDLTLVSRSGLIHLPQRIKNELNNPQKTNGELEISLNYDSHAGAAAFHITGENVSLNDYHFDKCSLHGKQNGDVWTIDQLLLDDISLAADLRRLSNSWKANFIGIRMGEALLLGLEGDYFDGEEVFKAKVNLLEVNLESINTIPALAAYLNTFSPKGILRGTGTLQLEADSESPSGWKIDTLLNTSFRSLVLNGIYFQDAVNASCHYLSKKGIAFRQIKTGLKDSKEGNVLAQLNIEKIEYDFNKTELLLDSLHFNISPENLSYAANLLQRSFPDSFDRKIAAMFSSLKQDERLEGSLTLQRSPAFNNLQISFKEGRYQFNNMFHQLNHLVLKYNFSELRALAQYNYKNNVFWLTLQTAAPDFSRGILVFSDYYPDNHHKANSQQPLTVHWQNDDDRGIILHKAEGAFNGMHFRLFHDQEVLSNKDALYLEGVIAFDAPKAAKYISNELCAKLSDWQMGDGYQLTGRWRIGKNQAEQMSSQIHFHGVLEGSDIALKGYQFQKLLAEVSIQPHHIQFHHLKLEDPAGNLHIEHGTLFEANQGNWHLNIPLISIADFRPSLLREEGMPSVKEGKSLVIRHMDLENLKGSLEDCRYLTGKGKLHFLNPPKKNHQSTIFAIPGEILTMLGLNLTVLNPVSGTIFYDIKDGRAHLTKFKDVYSDGKLSKFNLSKSTHPSYVDFDGNLQVQVKMKQYNLFFKLAELFTVNVGGTLFKPTYSLQKQPQN